MTRAVIIAVCFLVGCKSASINQLTVSIAKQQLIAGDKKYLVSTSRFGAGNKAGSNKTATGRMVIIEKVGAGMPAGTIFKGKKPTKYYRGGDAITSRILVLHGLEKQNSNVKRRLLYIHGTTDECDIGKPVSWGCVRMKNKDIIELFDKVNVGTLILIQ